MKNLAVIVLSTVLLQAGCSEPTASTVVTTPVCASPSGTIQQTCFSPATQLHYWLYLPPSVPETSGEAPALLVYLHGFDQSGADLRALLGRGIPMEIEKGKKLPLVVISPQCPFGDNWQYLPMVDRLHQLVEEAVVTYAIDPRKVYLTGFSMGGDGVWAVGIAYPEQFGALVPVGSWYDNRGAVCALKEIPVWVFQGEQDEIVSMEHARGMVDALKQCGGQVKLTLYPEAGHVESSRLAYEEDGLYSWLMEQRRR